MAESKAPTIALIGAGAIAESFHLPALARRPAGRDHLIVVDRDTARARSMANAFGHGRYATDYREILREVQGVIIALPPRLHFSVSQECLAHGIHVLCEKTLTETAAQARALIATAAQAGVTLSVNNNRRLFSSTRQVATLIASGELGAVRAIDFEEGDYFDWPVAGDAYFGVKAGGRGVLADRGAHVLDLICWWLGGSPEVISFQDDSLGGTEATCEARLAYQETLIRVRLSWLGKLRNRYRISFTTGATIEHGTADPRNPTLIRPNGRRAIIRTAAGPATTGGFADLLVENFVAAIQGRAAPLVPADVVVPSIALIEACYSRRTRFVMPWYQPTFLPAPVLEVRPNLSACAEVA